MPLRDARHRSLPDTELPSDLDQRSGRFSIQPGYLALLLVGELAQREHAL